MADNAEDLYLTGPFYCHNCEQEIPSCTVDYTCTICNGGFIEPTSTSQPPPPSRMDGSMVFSTLFGGGDDDDDDEDDEMASYDEEEDDEHHHHHHHHHHTRSSSSSSTTTATQGPVSIAINHAPTTTTSAPRTRRTRISIHRLNNNSNPSDNNNNFFNNFLQQFLNGLMGNNNIRNNNNIPRNVNVRPFFDNSNINDFVWTRGGLDNIITMFMNQLDNMGPPPAGKDTIDSLPTTRVSQQFVDENIQCHVCMEDFVLDEEVRQLPCKHVYHQDCITPWLELHGTCPICRNPVESNNNNPQQQQHDTNNNTTTTTATTAPTTTTTTTTATGSVVVGDGSGAVGGTERTYFDQINLD